VPETVYELLATEVALEKIGARGIAVDEARQVPRNAHVTITTRAQMVSETRGGC
jgi:hypothetical protein